ncbi:MAG TPA: hypothetical protein VF171_07685 [Trueperaceae bacterium]
MEMLVPPHRIHLFGASGSGTSTLGKLLAGRLGVEHFDADDYYWQRTDPPYTVKNPPAQRVRLLLADMAPTDAWVLSGSVVSWGDAFIPRFSVAVLVSVPHEARMQRLRLREKERYGARIEAGGDMHEHSRAFLAWAAQYDRAGVEMRSRAAHEQWLRRLACPVVRVCNDGPPAEVAEDVLRLITN